MPPRIRFPSAEVARVVGKALRLERARDMLHADTCRVTEAALAGGFQHLGRLSRDFRRHFGVSPSALRASKAQRN